MWVRASIILLLAIAGCSRAPERLSTDKVVDGAGMRAAFPYATLGDAYYAQVRAEALPGFYNRFKSDLFKQGVVRWDERYDCNHFASHYVALAQVRYYLASFHSRTPAQSLALGTYWVKTGPNTAHALVVALTDRGIVYIEPQTGKEVPSSDVKGQPLLALF